MIQISEEQQNIINTRRDTIVVSNPGTGKTTTLSLRVIKLLEDKINPENILCITFTDKARKEMFEAIYEMGKGKFPNADIMKLNIHTFHNFAYGYLRDAGEITGKIVGNNLMRFSILNSFEQNNALHYEKDYVVSQIVPKTENAIRYIKSFGITPDKIDITKARDQLENFFDKKSSYTPKEMEEFLRYFVNAYDEYEKSKCGAVDYNDMLLIFLKKFRGNKFEHVLVDEMQDMNEIEAKIVTKVARNLFLVGDAKQAIFGFQGGSVKNFQKFMGTCETKLLSTNRRSSQQILDYSKEYFLERTKDREEFQEQLDLFNSDKTGETPKVISTGATLSQILETIEENPNKTVGIVTRTNEQIIKISKFLDANNVEYASTSSQATAQQAKGEIQRYIRGLLSDKTEDKVSATFTVFAPHSLQEAFEFSKALKTRDHEKLSKIKLDDEAELSRNGLDRVFATKILPNCVSKGAEWLATATSVKQQVDEYLALEAPTLGGLLDFIVIGEESYVERDSKSNVTLTTAHKAKGRDFDIVMYIPSTVKVTSFIDVIVKSILSSCGINVDEEIEEESLRVDFVAFTRAKEKLIVIADNRSSENYHIEGLSVIEVDDSKDAPVATHTNEGLSEAYSLFVAGRFSASEKLLKDGGAWLEKYIEDYFKNIDHLSYSNITKEPYQFLKKQHNQTPTRLCRSRSGQFCPQGVAEDFDKPGKD